MANGSAKFMEDVRAGEKIVGTELRGDYRRYIETEVLDHWRTPRKPAYRITLEDGRELIASADHRFLSARGRWKHVTGKETGRARRPHLTTNDKLLGLGASVAGPVESTDYKLGYVCGMIRGDGYVWPPFRERPGIKRAPEFRLALIDDEGLDRTNRYLRDASLTTREYVFQAASPTRRGLKAIRFGGQAKVEALRDLVEYPVAISLDWSKGFLAGIFDAEGSYSCGILRISNTDPTITYYVRTSLARLGFDAILEGVPDGPGKGKAATVRLRGGTASAVRFFQCVDPAITRKRSILGRAVKNSRGTKVAKVEPVGIWLPMYDMTTGTGDFIANGVISHNCYARPSHQYWDFGAGTDFERKIIAKVNAPAVLREQFMKRSWKGELVVFSGNTDCYQPLEASYELTRGCLEVMREFQNPMGMITKGALVRRDIDILQDLARVARVHVNISLAWADEDMARKMEPGAPSPAVRLKAMRALADAGIPVGVALAPIIPGMNDSQVAEILTRARDAGATWAFRVMLRLPSEVKPVFLGRLQQDFPDRAKKVENAVREMRGGELYVSEFGKRGVGEGARWEAIAQLFDLTCRKLGLNAGREDRMGDDKDDRPTTFRRPGDQLRLF